MSDGLIAPFNAPPAGAAVPGIQPGSTGVDYAQIVIIYGPASGLFEYAPGTVPGPGNPPVVAVTSSTTDPFGNPLPGGAVARIVVQSSGGTGPYAVLTSSDANGRPGLLFPSRRPEEKLTAEVSTQVNNAGMANEFLITTLTGPSVTAQPDFVDIGLASSNADGSGPATAFYEYCDKNGIFYECIEISSNGVTIPFANQIIGQKPGQAVPTSDTWQNLSPLGAGFNVTGNNFNGDPCYAEYTFEPMGPKGSVHIRGNINVTAGPGNAFKLLTGASLPTGYLPAKPRYFPVSFDLAAIVSGSNNAMGMGVLEPSGAIYVFGGAGSAGDSAMVFEATIRLD